VQGWLTEQRLGLAQPRGRGAGGPAVPVPQPPFRAGGAGAVLQRPQIGFLQQLGAASGQPSFVGTHLGDRMLDGVVGQLPRRQRLLLHLDRTHVRMIALDAAAEARKPLVDNGFAVHRRG
jgi:hypothetical protein